MEDKGRCIGDSVACMHGGCWSDGCVTTSRWQTIPHHDKLLMLVT